MTYTVVVVNMEMGEHHPDRRFPNMDELEMFCDTEYTGWTSLVVTVLPYIIKEAGRG